MFKRKKAESASEPKQTWEQKAIHFEALANSYLIELQSLRAQKAATQDKSQTF